jgi:hypothetical protein
MVVIIRGYQEMDIDRRPAAGPDPGCVKNARVELILAL